MKKSHSLQTVRIKHIFLFLFITIVLPIYSQSTDKLDITIESAGTLTDGNFAPFWITSNNNGIGSEKTNNGYIRSALVFNNHLFKNKLKISLGTDIIVAHNLQSDFYFHQLYANFKYRKLELSIGAKERNSLFKNKNLSSGGLALSNNFRPLPQIEFGIPEFTDVPLSKGYLQIMGGLSFGKFLDNDYKKHHGKDGNYGLDVLYHKKYAFLKFENNPRWNFIIGTELNTQWGGDLYRKGEWWIKSPTNFKNFLKILVPGGGDSNATESDQVNILGNVNGSFHFIFNYNANNFHIKTYYEHFFEDKSGIRFRNMPDGLYGLEINLNKKQLISTILFEYIYTRDQSGSNKNPDGSVRLKGNDNYYNHGEYGSMTYYGSVLGNPLLVSPMYNSNGYNRSIYIYQNKIIAYHFGISGNINNELQHRIVLTYSRNYGSPLKLIQSHYTQFSSLAEVIYQPVNLKSWTFSGAIAYDNAKHTIGKNFGGHLKIAKNFRIK